MNPKFTVKADFSGGLDLVFDGKTEIKVEVPHNATASHLIRLLADHYANSKK